MDPLSITASVLGISGTCAAVIKGLKDVHDKYQQADLTILAICSESGAVQAALSQIEYILSRDEDAVVERFRQQPVLASAFDSALTGCKMLYTCLEGEVNQLQTKLEQDGSLDWKRKFKTVWKQDTMAGFQQQIRGQELALTTLLHGLQMESLIEIRRLLQSREQTFEKVDEATESLRATYPQSVVPDSIFENARTAESIFAADSVLGPEEFAFDDLVINSKTYRRAMAKAQALLGKADDDVPATSGAEDSGDADDAASIAQIPDRDPPPSPSTLPAQTWEAPAVYRTFVTAKTGLHEGLPSLENNWFTAFGLRKADLEGRNRHEVEFQNIYWEILETEHILNAWPKVVADPSNFATRMFADMDAIKSLHERELYLPLLEQRENFGAWASFDPDIWIRFVDNAEPIYESFTQTFHTRLAMVQHELESSLAFRQLADRMRSHPWSKRLSWDNFLKSPVTRIQRYGLLLATLNRSCEDSAAKAGISRAEAKIKQLVLDCNAHMAAGERVQRMDKLASCLGDEVAREVELFDPERRILRHEELPCLVHYNGAGPKGVWHDRDIVQLDNALLVDARGVEADNVKQTDKTRTAAYHKTPDYFVFPKRTLQLDLGRSPNWTLPEPLKLGTFATNRGSVPRGSTLFLWRLDFSFFEPSSKLRTPGGAINLGFPSMEVRSNWLSWTAKADDKPSQKLKLTPAELQANNQMMVQMVAMNQALGAPGMGGMGA